MKKIGLIGENLSYSYSPLIHSKFGGYGYELCEVGGKNLEKLLRSEEYAGFNVTMPYKKRVTEYCGEISERAQRIGSVNTLLRREDGSLKGYNTDYEGFTYLLKKAGIDVKGLKCTVLGSGGASLTVQAVLKDSGASEIVVISRRGKNNYGNISRHFDSEMIVNATPVGMYPNSNASPVDLGGFRRVKGVVDLIYNPNRTKLVLDAMERGIPSSGGLEMLVAQAKRSGEIFRGEPITAEEMEDVIKEVRRETLNTILIGMPGAGKTTLGKEMARRMGRKFVDTDDLVAEHERMSIPEIFARKGESYFRKVETEMLEKACALSGLVIAAGGGIVKKRANYNIVKQNGVVIWVKRDVEKLKTEGRPLSESIPLKQLYEERKGAYADWSDFFINNNEERG